MIDDDLSKFIMGGVSHNISLIELNLSHNRLGTERYLLLFKYSMIFLPTIIFLKFQHEINIFPSSTNKKIILLLKYF